MADEGIDEVFFKKAHGGWLFKMWTPYIIGQPAAYFLVTEPQKAAIAQKLRSNRAIRLAIVLPGILLAAPVAVSLPIPKAPAWVMALMSLFLAYGLIALTGLIECHRLRPLLDTACRAQGRITLADQFWNSARYTSFSLLLLLFAIFAANLVLAIAIIGHRNVLLHAAGLIIYGTAALYFGALTAVKIIMSAKRKN